MDDQTTGGAGGPEALPEPPWADPIAGELVTETLDYDGGRQVTVYVPVDSPQAVVFAGDGQGISKWGGFLEARSFCEKMVQGNRPLGCLRFEWPYDLHLDGADHSDFMSIEVNVAPLRAK